MRAARALEGRGDHDAQIVVAALDGHDLEATVGSLAEELDLKLGAVEATAVQLARVLRDVAARCADDSVEQQTEALSHLLAHAHELLAAIDPSDDDPVGDDHVSGVVATAAERAPSILPESGVVRRGTLRQPSEPGGSQPGVVAPGPIQIAQAADDFDDETEVTMPAITRMNVSVFEMMDDDESEHTLPGVAPPSTRRNGLRLG